MICSFTMYFLSNLRGLTRPRNLIETTALSYLITFYKQIYLKISSQPSEYWQSLSSEAPPLSGAVMGSYNKRVFHYGVFYKVRRNSIGRSFCMLKFRGMIYHFCELSSLRLIVFYFTLHNTSCKIELFAEYLYLCSNCCLGCCVMERFSTVQRVLIV